jgi:aspartate/methionine/tyrosine aminotransferase
LTVEQIARRRAAHLLKYPDAKIISLGIGDTTEPIPNVITNAMAEVPSCQTSVCQSYIFNPQKNPSVPVPSVL